MNNCLPALILSHRPPFCKWTPAIKDEPLQAMRSQDHSTKGDSALGWPTGPNPEQACSGAPCTPPEMRSSHTSRGSSLQTLKAGALGSWQGLSAAPRVGGGGGSERRAQEKSRRTKDILKKRFNIPKVGFNNQLLQNLLGKLVKTQFPGPYERP